MNFPGTRRDSVVPVFIIIMTNISPENSAGLDLFCPSEAMRLELINLFKYTEYAGIDAGRILDAMKKEGLLPAADRRHGKLALLEFRNRIIDKVRCD